LTLALLKSGTSARDIQTAVNVASAARLVIVEEYAELTRIEESWFDARVANIREVRRDEPASRKPEPHIDGMHSEIKALLSLLLLQHGASQKEILTTLRLATAAARTAGDEDEPDTVDEDAPREPERRGSTPKQVLRNEQLAPIAKVMRAA
jgi:hypothetical protein